MQDFIVLGIIPGTEIQLTFLFWTYALVAFFGAFLAYHLAPSRQTICALLISWQLNQAVRRSSF